MFDRCWDFLVQAILVVGIPLVSAYHAVCSNSFLNVAIVDAPKLEQVADLLLTPVQYVLAGKEAILRKDGEWVVRQRFDYDKKFVLRSAAATVLFPLSLSLGSLVKTISFFNEKSKQLHASFEASRQSTIVRSNYDLYWKMGLNVQDASLAEFSPSLGYERRPGDEHHMQKTKEGLKTIGDLLTEAGIPWWVDCGTLLGAYRYGGIIPWDYDIDIAVLIPDFENVRRILNRLDPEKYTVQDWSGRSLPNSYFKVLVKETHDFIDLYFYDIDPKNKELRYIFSLEDNIFFFEWWKIDERRFKKPIAFDAVFPLKKTLFDGIEVFIPNETVPFLQRYYGENLAPAKVYNPMTQTFEKDLSHPYWQNAYVH